MCTEDRCDVKYVNQICGHHSSSPFPVQPNVEPYPVSTQEQCRAIPTFEKNCTPIFEALNLSASATSLREDIAVCEQIMTEMHHFLVLMLDSMARKVSCIGEKFKDLEHRVNKLGKK